MRSPSPGACCVVPGKRRLRLGRARRHHGQASPMPMPAVGAGAHLRRSVQEMPAFRPVRLRHRRGGNRQRSFVRVRSPGRRSTADLDAAGQRSAGTCSSSTTQAEPTSRCGRQRRSRHMQRAWRARPRPAPGDAGQDQAAARLSDAANVISRNPVTCAAAGARGGRRGGRSAVVFPLPDPLPASARHRAPRAGRTAHRTGAEAERCAPTSLPDAGRRAGSTSRWNLAAAQGVEHVAIPRRWSAVRGRPSDSAGVGGGRCARPRRRHAGSTASRSVTWVGWPSEEGPALALVATARQLSSPRPIVDATTAGDHQLDVFYGAARPARGPRLSALVEHRAQVRTTAVRPTQIRRRRARPQCSS